MLAAVAGGSIRVALERDGAVRAHHVLGRDGEPVEVTSAPENGPNSPHGQHSRSQIFELANVFRARVVDLAPESIMLEMTGAASKIEGLLQVLRESSFEVLEVSRTGRMAMRRGHHTSRVLSALGSRPKANGNGDNHGSKLDFHGNLGDEILPNEFENVHEEEI